MNKSRLILSSIYASIVTIVFVVVITIWAELATPLKDWLKSFSGHHWTSKSIFSALVYTTTITLFYLSLRQSNDSRLKRALTCLLVVTALGVITLTLFFTSHHFKLI